MNEKITLQDLAALLAQRHEMNPADAEAFVGTLFTLIEEALETDRYVKVKGLGTFKLLEVEARESVDVNTGARIEIQSHSRIAFAPDPMMREAVNKPFSHFETVALNPQTHFNDMEEETLSKEVPVALSPEAVREPESPAKAVTEEPASQPRKNRELPWCMIASVLFAGILLGGGITWKIASGRRYVTADEVAEKKAPKTSPENAEMFSENNSADKEKPTQVFTKTSQPFTAVYQTPESQNKTKKETLADTVEYLITGTQAEYTLKPGDNLARIARQFYGNKKLWPYVARHNRERIKNPNNIPVGTTIQIPRLSPKNAPK